MSRIDWSCGTKADGWFFIIIYIYVYLHKQGYSRTRELDSEELLEQLPALQQLLYRLIGCRVSIFNLFNRPSKILYIICLQ